MGQRYPDWRNDDGTVLMATIRINLRLECRLCLQAIRWASKACTPILIFLLCGVAYADNALEQWRNKAGETRLLAENDTTRAYAEAERLQTEFPADATPADRARLLNLLARIEVYRAQTEKAATHIQQAMELANQHNDPAGQAEADLNTALNAVNQARIDDAIAAAIHGVAVLDGVDRPDLLGEALLRMAMMYRRTDQLDESITMSMQALDIARQSNNPLALAYAYYGLAIAYEQSEHYSEAHDYYQRMLEQARVVGSRMLEGHALLGLGNTNNGFGDFKSAERLIREAIAVFRDIDVPFSLNFSQFALADNLRRQGRYAETLPIFEEIIERYRRYPNKIGLWWTLNARSSNYMALNDIAAARRDVEQAYALAKEIGVSLYLTDSAKRVAEIAAAKGDHRHAYRLMLEASDMAAKAAKDNAATRLLQLTRRYQTESKQREIDKLNRRNQQQAAELKHRSLEQRWLWTVLSGSVVMLVGTGFFLMRQRRSHRWLEVLNTEVLQAKNKLQATLDTIPDLLFEVGLDGRYYDYHSPRTELLLYPFKDLRGKTMADVMPADAAKIVMSALLEAYEHGISTGKQFQLPLPHGDFWFELSVASKPVADGEEPRLIVLSRNITERKHMETQALQREQEFRVLVENSPDLIFRYDKNCHRIYTNPAVARFVGKQRADALLNKSPAEAKILSADEAHKLMQMIRQVLTTGQPAESEVECLGADGQLHYFHNRYAPEFNAHGEVVGVISIARDVTERKQAERRLWLMDFALNQVREAVYIIELANHNFISVNDEACRALGYSREELLRMNVLDIDPDGDRAEMQQLQRDIDAADLTVFERRHKTKDGHIFPVEINAQVFEYEGRPTSIALARDITERKRTQHDIALMSQALSKVREAAYLMGDDARFLYVNDESCRALGYTRGELLTMAVMDINPGSTVEMVRELWQRQREERTVQPFETAHRRKDGSIFPVEINASQFEYDGKTYGLSLVRDITERKRIEAEIHALNADLEQRVLERTEELRQQTRYLRTLIDTLPMLAWLKDKESRFLVVNQAMALACAHSVDDLVGKSVLDFWPREHAEAYDADDAEVMATGQRKTVEEPFVDVRDGTIWIETFKAPILDEDGSVLGTVGIARDISDRKAMEMAREAALAEAERLAKLRSEFMARMSHELRTPLNSILGYSQILRGENKGNERQSMMLNVIQQSGDYLLNLINDILDFAKIEAGKQELSLSDVHLPRFLRNLADIITLKAEQKGLVFVCDIAADVPAGIRADETRLRQVLLNLLSNAVKYSERGQISLRVTVLEPGRLRFEVQDTGIGIDTGQLETIFQAFEQAGDRQNHTGGTGLGLPISRELVKLMGSDIHVTSRVGEGSTFWFDLDAPVVEVCGDIMADEQYAAGYQGLRRRVLVVDDVNENRALLIDILSRLGFETCEAANGRECLDSVETQTPDLILLDRVMPEMDGLETARRLRRLPGFGHTPIIAVSASASGRDVAEAMKAGVNVFLSKPIDIKRLMAHLAVLLKFDWIYTLPETGMSPQRQLNESLVAPPLEEMNILHRLAQEGSMRDIIRQATHLEELDPRYRPFAAQLRALAQGYQSRAILDLVERYINSTGTTHDQ
ncbi:MAG: PAS domain S-box protein [Methylobacter sp.]|nr:PAS domain S-box protein [Methylobacter sp.]